MQTVSPVCTYSGHKDFATDCSFSESPFIAISTSDDRKVNLWRIGEESTRRETLKILPDAGWKCSVTDNGDTAAVACNDGYVRVWRTEDCTLLHILKPRGFDCSYGVALSALGKYLVASFFNTETRAGLLVKYILPSQSQLQMPSHVRMRATVQNSWLVPLAWDHGSVSISKYAEVVAVASSEGLQMFEGIRGLQMFSSSDLTRNFDVSISAKGKIVAVADRKRLQIFYQRSSGVWRFRNYDGYKSPMSPCCSISADGKRALAAMYDGSFRLWSVHRRHPIFSLQGHVGPGRGCAISKNGALAMTTGVDRTVRFWELDGIHAILPTRLKIEEKDSFGNSKIENDQDVVDISPGNVENNSNSKIERKRERKKSVRAPSFQTEVEEIREVIPRSREVNQETQPGFLVIRESRLFQAIGSFAGDMVKWLQRKLLGESAAPAD